MTAASSDEPRVRAGSATPARSEARRTYTVEEVSLMAGVGRRLMYAAIRRGEVPGVIYVGRRILLGRVAIDAWLNGGLDHGNADTVDER